MVLTRFLQTLQSLKERYYFLFIFAFLLLLGWHGLDYSLYFFALFGLFFVDKKILFTRDTIIFFIFIGSVYVTWVFLDTNLLHYWIYTLRLFSQGVLVFVMYLIGRSIPVFQKGYNVKILFYLLFVFFIAYVLSIGYSYFVFPENRHLSSLGMLVWFQNEYKRLHVNGGHLISTIIAYYLTFAAMIVPILVLKYNKMLKVGFNHFELLFLLAVSVFALFIAGEMGRRTVLVLTILSFLILILWDIKEYLSTFDAKKFIFWGLALTIILVVGYYFMHDTPAIKKLFRVGLHDKRFSWWLSGIKAMMDYPWGGGHGVFLAHNMKLTHNTWIDIGKDFGILPFLSFILVSMLSLYYAARLLFFSSLKNLNKQLIILMTITMFAIMMIEPVFTSDKTFFAYISFFYGLLKNIYDTTKDSTASMMKRGSHTC